MLPRKNRLNLARERFTRGDKQFSDHLFKLIVKKNFSDGPKAGLIVSGKVGKAAVRNRTRRVLTEALAERLDIMPKDSHLIFIVHPKAAGSSKEEMAKALDSMISRL